MSLYFQKFLQIRKVDPKSYGHNYADYFVDKYLGIEFGKFYPEEKIEAFALLKEEFLLLGDFAQEMCEVNAKAGAEAIRGYLRKKPASIDMLKYYGLLFRYDLQQKDLKNLRSLVKGNEADDVKIYGLLSFYDAIEAKDIDVLTSFLHSKNEEVAISAGRVLLRIAVNDAELQRSLYAFIYSESDMHDTPLKASLKKVISGDE